MRVYELSKEYGNYEKATDFLKIIQDFGVDVTSHMSSLDVHQIDLIKEKIQESLVNKEDLENTESTVDKEDSGDDEMEVKRNGDSLEITISREDFEASPSNVSSLVAEDMTVSNDTVSRRVSTPRDLVADIQIPEKVAIVEVEKPKGFFGWIKHIFL